MYNIYLTTYEESTSIKLSNFCPQGFLTSSDWHRQKKSSWKTFWNRCRIHESVAKPAFRKTRSIWELLLQSRRLGEASFITSVVNLFFTCACKFPLPFPVPRIKHPLVQMCLRKLFRQITDPELHSAPSLVGRSIRPHYIFPLDLFYYKFYIPIYYK